MRIKEAFFQNKILEILKEYNESFGLVTESKLKVLIDKIGMSEENAKILDDKFGPLSVWMARKIGEYMSKEFPDEYPTPKDGLKRLYFKTQNWTNQFSSIKDYIAVGLNGNKSSLDNLNYTEIYRKSKEWHDQLNVGGAKINYQETNPVILDFRDENDNGYYWVDLQTNNSTEECERMGHCGRSGRGKLYSLRSFNQLPNNKFKVNKSHLTAAIGDDGILYQLKGAKNSKPKEEYHQYILPLFNLVDDDDDYFIKGFGTEYASQQDFKLEDLPIQTLKDLYGVRPEIFKSRGLQSKMKELGVEIEVEPLETSFYVEIEFEYIRYYIDNDEIISRVKKQMQYGGSYTEEIYLSDALFNPNKIDILYEWIGDEYSLPSYKYPRLEEVLKENVYPGLRSHIIRLLKMMEPTEEQLNQLEKIETEPSLNISILAHLMRQIDSENIMIINDIYDCYDISYRDSIANIAIDELKQSLLTALEGYGDVSNRRYGIDIGGDIGELVDIDDSEVIAVYNQIEHDYGEIYTSDVFRELVERDVISKPWWRRPEISEVDIDNDRFNEELNERLNYIERHQI